MMETIEVAGGGTARAAVLVGRREADDLRSGAAFGGVGGPEPAPDPDPGWRASGEVDASLVFSWLRDPRFEPDEAAVEEHVGFLPVEVVDAGAEPDRGPGAGAPAPEGCIDTELAGGHRLRITGAHDPEALARLIGGLSDP